MGLGPTILGLYRQLKTTGILDDVESVVELGSQGVWCPDRRMLVGLFDAFNRPMPPVEEVNLYINTTGTGHAPSRHLHEKLGFRYECVDIDGQFGAIPLDMNFDPVPAEHHGKYGLTTNHGTTEHVFNQYNAFKMIHDFTRPGGLMLHALPFTVHLEHGFFNYQPNIFDALARFNSYKTLGMWVGPDWSLSSLVPWEPRLLDFMRFDAHTTHLLVVLQQKMHAKEFCVPVQTIYEDMVPDPAFDRYKLVVDGEYYMGRRFRQVSFDRQNTNLEQIPMVAVVKHLAWRIKRRLARSLGR